MNLSLETILEILFALCIPELLTPPVSGVTFEVNSPMGYFEVHSEMCWN